MSNQIQANNLLPCDGIVTYYPHFLPDINLNDIEWRQDYITLYGKTYPIPRLQAWYGTKSYSYSGIQLHPHPWTVELLTMKNAIETFTNYTFNSVLINKYRHGQDSVGWHADDEPELGQNPVIASISLGETRSFYLKHKFQKLSVKIPLESNSLLLMAGKTQHFWLHSIPKTKQPIGERINLTFRQIQKD